MRRRIPKEIPGGAGPLGHRVGFSLRRSAAIWATGIDPVVDCGERRLTSPRRLVALDFGQADGQIVFRNRNKSAIDRTVHNRDRLSPVTLPGKNPIAEFVVYGSLS